MAMNIIVGADKIGKAISSIETRGKNLDASIWVAGVSVLAHATAHSDPSLCDKLVNALPKGGRKLALVEWMLAYGQIRKLDPKADKAAIATGRIFAYDKTRVFDREGAEATPWTEFKKEAAVHTAFDAQAALKSVLARISSASRAGLTIERRAEALKSVEELAALLRGDSEGGEED